MSLTMVRWDRLGDLDPVSPPAGAPDTMSTFDGERQERPDTPWGQPGWWRGYSEVR